MCPEIGAVNYARRALPQITGYMGAKRTCARTYSPQTKPRPQGRSCFFLPYPVDIHSTTLRVCPRLLRYGPTDPVGCFVAMNIVSATSSTELLQAEPRRMFCRRFTLQHQPFLAPYSNFTRIESHLGLIFVPRGSQSRPTWVSFSPHVGLAFDPRGAQSDSRQNKSLYITVCSLLPHIPPGKDARRRTRHRCTAISSHQESAYGSGVPPSGPVGCGGAHR